MVFACDESVIFERLEDLQVPLWEVFELPPPEPDAVSGEKSVFVPGGSTGCSRVIAFPLRKPFALNDTPGCSNNTGQITPDILTFAGRAYIERYY